MQYQQVQELKQLHHFLRIERYVLTDEKAPQETLLKATKY